MDKPQETKPLPAAITPPELEPAAYIDQLTGMSLDQLWDESYAIKELRNMRLSETPVPAEELAAAEQAALWAASMAIRQALPYEFEADPWQSRFTGNCYAYSILLSDFAEAHGFTSRIGYVSGTGEGHAFDLVFSDTGQVHLLNPGWKHLLLFDIKNNPIANGVLKPGELEEIGHPDFEQSGYEFRHSGIQQYSDAHRAMNGRGGFYWLQGKRPAAGIMRPDVAKRALFTHQVFRQALAAEDLPAVTATLEALQGYNPQYETRRYLNPDIRAFRRLVRSWALDDAIDPLDIETAIERYETILPDTRSRDILVADCLRAIGTRRANIRFLQKAQHWYQEAMRKSAKPDPILAGKWAMNRSLLGALEIGE